MIVAGDMNKKDFSGLLADFPELTIQETGATRKMEHLDIVLTNFHEHTIYEGTRPPLVNGEGVPSDHRLVLTSYKLPDVHHFIKTKFEAVQMTRSGREQFWMMIVNESWEQVLDCVDPSTAVMKLN